MLVAFRARNARSFRDEIELSLLATRMSEPGVPREISWRESGRPIEVLPALGVFGANASGKSNLLKTMGDMRDFVLNSFRRGKPGTRLPTRPFRLGEDEGSNPSCYEVELVLDGVRHQYGFELDAERILREWARSYPHGRPVLLLAREGDNLQLGSQQRAKGRATEEILRDNALFLSTAAATNHPLFLPLFQWFQRNLLYADVQTRGVRQAFTTKLLEHEDRRRQVLDLLREADLGITDVSRQEVDPEFKERLTRAMDIIRGEDADDDLGDLELHDFELNLTHSAGGHEIELGIDEESWGTMIWFGLIGVVVEALREGSVLLVDEIEASLHPALAAALVDLFQSQRSNPYRAQLLFNSHEVTLMGDTADRPLGRDQIWLTEKGVDGATRLLPLVDMHPRREESIARRYLAGRYGGVPIISQRTLERIAAPVGGGD
ncbi:MAG: ATP-binding protein [Solirubrobacterales bacterium]|nr:ATP-binding protein [Solirubrobacterales bacterium]